MASVLELSGGWGKVTECGIRGNSECAAFYSIRYIVGLSEETILW